MNKLLNNKTCHPQLYFDHKDTKTLKLFISPFTQIEPRGRSSFDSDKPTLKPTQQKRLTAAIKRARFLALLPYVGEIDK